jgi:hypothetical protein
MITEEVKVFIQKYKATYGLNDKHIYSLLQSKEYIYLNSLLFIYTDKGDYVYNDVLLYDVNQTNSKITSLREFKALIKSFKKPVVVRNVSKEFTRLVKPTNEKGLYVWVS